jgi:hypothetical protein
LDLTVKEKSHLEGTFLMKTLTEVTQWVYDQSGIEFPPETIAIEILSPQGGSAAQGKVGYRGPLGLRGSPPRIKLDLTGDEKVGYRLDRIREVNVSQISFQPKFVVELSEIGGIGAVSRLERGH